MIPWTKTSEKEETSLLSQVQHILNVEISAIERVILSLTISNQNYFEEESNIDLELLYVGLTNSSSAKKCS